MYSLMQENVKQQQSKNIVLATYCTMNDAAVK